MTDNTETTVDEQQENSTMTEQIEASFGPVSVSVCGKNTEDVQNTFDHVWETMMETSEKMKSMSDKSDDGDDSPGRTFGD